jgi:glutamate-ammonia-ligase adenylyltransferase
LDFWAIQDVHSIKRQIQAQKGGAEIAVKGHNIKLGRGGIREIEFFAQTQQLIWGGRDARLRQPRTREALAALAEAGQIDAAAAEELTEAYHYLRRVEHRLQMVADQQTHQLPADGPGLEAFAAFLGYDGAADFEADLLSRLRLVEYHYAHLFEEAPDLAGPGDLVFTGGEIEPGTLATLEGMGFADAKRVFNLIRSWHHGRYRATRSTRSREILTEIMPILLQKLAATTDPDQALTRFDQFLEGLPAGVQLFSLLHANPLILDLLAEIMGGAPMLAERLGRNPGLLDAVLTPGFFDRIPDRRVLAAELDENLCLARDFQDVLDITRRWANDRRFQAGVHILRHSGDIDESGRALSDIAETSIEGLYRPVLEDMAARHGRVRGGGLAVVAMGKLGGREMTVSSDLDLIFLYDVGATAAPSDGNKPLDPSHYYARLAQRFINALTAKTAEGQLYDIDMRLRPSGNAGPIATGLSGFLAYYQKDAWTWEHMALTRARVMVAESSLKNRIEGAIKAVLVQPRDPAALLRAVAEMRRRIENERPAKSLWSVKYLRGGLVDLEFIAQYLQLRHAAQHPQVLDPSTQAAFTKLAGVGIIGPTLAGQLIEATRMMRQVQGMLRLTVGPAFDADSLPTGLQSSLARAAGLSDFAELKQRLIMTAGSVHEIFIDMIEEPARLLAPDGKP